MSFCTVACARHGAITPKQAHEYGYVLIMTQNKSVGLLQLRMRIVPHINPARGLSVCLVNHSTLGFRMIFVDHTDAEAFACDMPLPVPHDFGLTKCARAQGVAPKVWHVTVLYII